MVLNRSNCLNDSLAGGSSGTFAVCSSKGEADASRKGGLLDVSVFESFEVFERLDVAGWP